MPHEKAHPLVVTTLSAAGQRGRPRSGWMSLGLIGEVQVVAADGEHITFVDAFGVDLFSVVFDAVRAAEVLDVEHPVMQDDRRVFPRDVGIFDSQIRRFGTSPDDELLTEDRDLSTLEDERQVRLGDVGVNRPLGDL